MLLSTPITLCPWRSKCSTASEPINPLDPVTKIVFIRKSCLSGASRGDDAKAESHPANETMREKADHKHPVWPAHTNHGDSGACRRASRDGWRYRACEIYDDL